MNNNCKSTFKNKTAISIYIYTFLKHDLVYNRYFNRKKGPVCNKCNIHLKTFYIGY